MATLNPCIFCGRADVQMTKEDVVPVWLLKVLRSVYRQDSLDLTFRGRRLRRMCAVRHMIALREVCAACNGGWMHDLEGAFRAIAEPAIRKAPRPDSLHVFDRAAQLVLATWALKTWLLLQRSWHHVTQYSMWSPDALHYLYEHRAPPPGVRMYLSAVKFDASVAFGMKTTRLTHTPTDKRGVISFMHFRPLAFWFVAPDLGMTPWDAGLLPSLQHLQTAFAQIWPYESPEIHWPPARILLEAGINSVLPDELFFE